MNLWPSTATGTAGPARSRGPIVRLALGLFGAALVWGLGRGECRAQTDAQTVSWAILSRRPQVAQAPVLPPKRSAPEAVPAPQATAQSHRFAPIGELTLDTAVSRGLLPTDLAAETLGRQPALWIAPGMTRPWPPQVFCWYGVPLHYAPSSGHGSSACSGLPCAGRAADDAHDVPHDFAAGDQPPEGPAPDSESLPQP